MITLSQAKRRLCDSVSGISKEETVALSASLGRIASQDIISTLAIPPSDNSAMDGFAVNSSDIQTVPTSLAISQRIPAGTQPAPLKAGSAARIFTGGVIPDGADAVIIQENTDYSQENTHASQTVSLRCIASAGDNIRPQGQDITVGAVVVHRGQRISAVDMSLLASIGVTELWVYQPLKVAIFSTGDELVEPGVPLKVGQIYNSNRSLLMALCQQLGFHAIDIGIVADTLEATKHALLEATDVADVVLSSGGVSVGEEDHVKPAVQALGALDLWKVQMKPGKPVAFGRVADTAFLGLPGNPVSSFVIFQLLAVPLLKTLQGEVVKEPIYFSAKSGFAKKTTSREEYIRVKLSRDNSGQLIAEQFQNLSSGVMSSLSWADGLVRQAIDQAIRLGDVVDVYPLNEGML